MYHKQAQDPALQHYLREWSNEEEGPGDAIVLEDEELMGLTILDRPHISGLGSVVQLQPNQL